ncbi:MAG: hypothetical protein AAFP03_04275 [Cyanobacteria bacterium J06598_3]
MSDQAALDRKEISKLASKIVKDPILLRKLGDRIYQLLQEDARNQSERNGHSRRFYS